MGDPAESLSVRGWHCHLIKVRLWIRILQIAIRSQGLARGIASVTRLNRTIDRARAGRTLPRGVRVGKRYGWDLFAPAFPSRAFDRFVAQELLRHDPAAPGNRLQTAFLGVTHACPLSCRHCSAWDTRHLRDSLTTPDIARLVGTLVARGVTQIFFTGGEPMLRLDAIVEAAAPHASNVDFWLFTSGIRFSSDAAVRLREAGFTGVSVSVDDWRAEAHDAFRGAIGSFDAAIAASAAAREAGLAVAWTICPSREFVTAENLRRYVALAQQCGASFVQVMEPKAVGRYAGREVALDSAARHTLEEFALANDFDASRATPLIVYPDLAQRRIGCVGAGERYVFIAADGAVHPSPLCRGLEGNVLHEDVNAILDRMAEAGCRAASCPLVPLFAVS